MLSTSSFVLLATALSAIFSPIAQVAARPAPAPQASASASGSSDYWLANIDHSKDSVLGQSNGSYTVFRNVKDYGATGDGSTDDTAAINLAISSGNRCGSGCNSSTTSPAIVYFPPGTYVVSTEIIMFYYTQLIGDANNLPTIQASANFQGMAVLDADKYNDDGSNYYINQNNFFRQVRNFNIDLTKISGNTGAGIHWQVAQATSLQNIVFNMKPGSQQMGIFMDNGSGGFMSDLVFNGGQYGAFLGSQQFTSKNMTFNNCQTAIFMNWNWGWTLTGITVNGPSGCTTCVGLDMSNSPTNQTVGSVVLADSVFSNVAYGVRSAYKPGSSIPEAAGTLILNNVDMSSGVNAAVVGYDNSTILGSGNVAAWASGNIYDHSATGKASQGPISNAPTPPKSLLDSNGHIFSRSKPQYEAYSASDFLSAKANGCAGNGKTDDTKAIQSFLQNAAQSNKIAYFDHGDYIVSDTIMVPTTIKIVGECWSNIVASGFTDGNNPKPVFQVGSTSTTETGAVEISDILFEIKGPNPGAIMIDWNLQSAQGQSGIWDTHVRIGGSYGSELLLSNCAKTPSQTSANTNCEGAFMMFNAGPRSSGVYLENTWFWTADHDMEDPLNQQISVYNGRGMLIRSQGPVWLWGTSSEHSVLYNYQFDGVQDLFAGFMQSETPYYQPDPMTPKPYTYNSNFDDPTFTVCSNGSTGGSDSVPCQDSWGLRVVNSKNVFIYSTGLYSFFNNYDQTCVPEQNCQENMIHIQSSEVYAYAVTTKAAVNMIVDSQVGIVTDEENRSVYGATIGYYFTGA